MDLKALDIVSTKNVTLEFNYSQREPNLNSLAWRPSALPSRREASGTGSVPVWRCPLSPRCVSCCHTPAGSLLSQYWSLTSRVLSKPPRLGNGPIIEDKASHRKRMERQLAGDRKQIRQSCPALSLPLPLPFKQEVANAVNLKTCWHVCGGILCW